jgi:hypothetical protein
VKRVILLLALVAVTDLVFASAAWAPSRGMRIADRTADFSRTIGAAPAPTATATAAPAFARSTVGGDAQPTAGGDVAVLQYSCDQIQAAVNTQVQSGKGTGAGAGAAQSMHVDQQQVLACFGQAAALQESTVNFKVHGTATATVTAGGGGGSASAAAGGALPPTGGAPLTALGAAALLVAGGLLARRIVRQE